MLFNNQNILAFAQGRKTLTRVTLAFAIISLAAGTAVYAQDQTPSAARAESTKMFGALLQELEIYPDSGVAGVWAWMKDVEDGKGVIDAKTRELIGLAVASQIPCQYCIYYHRKAALAQGATEQELREAAAVAAGTRHWSTMLYGAEVDIDEYKAKMDKLFASQ